MIVTSRHIHVIPVDLFSLVENSLILITIVFLNHVVLPFMPGMSMKRRLGVGVLFFLLSALLGTLLKAEPSNIHSDRKFLWMLMPIVLYAIGEMLVFVTGICRILAIHIHYSQRLCNDSAAF